jgi:hypothetical protein
MTWLRVRHNSLKPPSFPPLPPRYAPPDTPPEAPTTAAEAIIATPSVTAPTIATDTALPDAAPALPTRPPGLTERGKIWATAKAPTRTKLGDDKYIASAVASLPRLHDFWTSHSHIRARIQTYEGLAERSTDGLWTFYALACAFTNTILDSDSSPAELADACDAVVDIITSEITGLDDYGVKIIPEHLRFPVPDAADTSPPILNYSASDFILPAIAALHPQDVNHYCLKNGIDDKSFAYEGLGRDVIFNRDAKIDQTAWLRCARVIYAKFHTLFREGIKAEALEVIIYLAHEGDESDVINPADAM